MNRMTFAACLAVMLLWSNAAQAYVEVSYTLGRVVSESSNIVLMKVEKVNKERRLIYYKKVADLKGQHPVEDIKHIITDGFNPREPKFIMDWAEPGKTALFFYQGGASETCIGDYWYQSYNQGEWWGMTHSEPFLAWAFSGKTEKLKTVVTDMLADKEVVVPCAQYDPAKIPEYKAMLHDKKCPLWRMKASLKILDYDLCIREKDKFVVGLGALGPEAVPGFVADLKKPDALTRLKAAIELGQIGEDAKGALTALDEALKDQEPEIRVRSAEALVRIDPKNATGLPVLVASLTDDKLRGTTIDILGSLGEPAKPAMPALVNALKDTRIGVQLKASDALLRIEPANPQAIDSLIGAVTAPAGGKVGWAVVEPQGLKSTGESTFALQPDKSVLLAGNKPAMDTYTMTLVTDRRAVTAIKLEALVDGSLPSNGPGRADNGNYVLTKLNLSKTDAGATPVKFKSAWADFSQQGFDVGNVAAGNGTGWAVAPELGKSHTAIFSLETPLAGGDNGMTLVCSLEFQSPHAQHQIGRFRISVTGDDDPLLNPRVAAAQMLGGVGAPARKAIPTLMGTLVDSDASLRQASAAALAKMAPDSISVLAGALKDPKVEVRLAAVESLSLAGEHTGAAIPQLIDAWSDADKSVRLRVGDQLQRFGGASGGAAPKMVASLSDPDRDIRLKACDVLGHCGGEGRAAGIPTLIKLVATPEDGQLRSRSAWVLGQIGPEAKDAVGTLTEAVKDQERDVRLLSLDALSKIVAEPKSLATVALSLLADPDRDVRIRAADLYGRGQPFGGGATVELFEDNTKLLLAQLTAEDGPAEAEANEKFAGAACIKVMPSQRYNPNISGWGFNIAEKPELGQYRYIRFAWKKAGGEGIMVQLSTNTRGWENRYCAGKNTAGWAATIVDEKLPGEWTIVTRDLFQDFGGAFQLNGMALTPMDGTAGYYDHIYLGRSIEELDKITNAAKKK